MRSLAIIGAGFSGSLLATHLLRRCPLESRIYLIEKSRRFGSGVAYSTRNPNHLLNVPAGWMSAFQDQPGHFLDWLQQQNLAVFPSAALDEMTFVPRWLFGVYMRDVLYSEIERHSDAERLTLVSGKVSALEVAPDGLVLQLDRDRQLDVDKAVLAIGNFPPQPPPAEEAGFYDTPYYRPDPWAEEALSGLDSASPVLLIGTGLTMIDTVLSLLDQGHSGPIYALSRRGLLPRSHAGDGTWQPFLHPSLPVSVVELLRQVRAEIRRAAGQGIGWRAVLNSLRPLTQSLWQALPDAQKARFLRHLRPWWDVHRHRLAPEVGERIAQVQRSGQLRVQAARIHRYRIEPEGVVVAFSRPRAESVEQLTVQRVINCSGPACDYARIRDPLVLDLLSQGLARPDPLRLGLDVDKNAALLDRAGRPSPRLYAVGPVTRGVFWEITAVPDIRCQCERLAGYLAARLQMPVCKAEMQP